jgi:hypothetical protein
VERREVDPPLARDPARQRRGLDPPVGTRRLLDLGHLLGAVRGCMLATLPLLVARGRAGALLLPRLLDLGVRLRSGDLLALRADHGDRLADRDLALGDGDLEQHA